MLQATKFRNSSYHVPRLIRGDTPKRVELEKGETFLSRKRAFKRSGS